jgi:two-component system alkaline phosphatase synthesis response regulator PhoP
MARILVIEDERPISSALELNLTLEGHEVVVAPDGAEGLKLWRELLPDLIVLDVMLPSLSGFDVCRQARAQGLRTPVLFLSAKGEPSERVEGLAAGGDDYLVKPFHLPEFLLRVSNLLRRAPMTVTSEQRFAFADVTIDFPSFTVHSSRGVEQLNEREMRLLQLFVARRNTVVSRNEILDAVWGTSAYPSSRTVDNFVVRLRRALEPDPARPRYLHTVWGVGYKFTPDA